MKFLTNKKSKKRGFTLIELLVVIAIIGVLAAFLIPAVTKAILSAKVTGMVNNGRQIYVSVFEANANDSLGTSISFPRTAQFTSTHEYFAALVTNETMNVTFDFFAGPGTTRHNSSSPSGFIADDCGWRVTEAIGAARDGVPFLISRNYTGQDIPGTTGTTGVGTDITADIGETTGNVKLEFNDIEVVVVQKGGATLRRAKKDLTNSAFINAATETYNLLVP